ncbi:Homotypic fusion and vacuole protein sorting (HOPS) complex component Vps39A [Monocercomonoides exilis]|uniref:Homotypic fusion and vacuole protein sorting (HOPS) complex component Vps39A n=1 Tax=Monocercomonoides exilis TaxID=2049356 RepID=UPI00355A95BD|nr:Homotypic fusion and vacuole protein sorting (HOPS) complex component Vps39A [Monocercomonoides exilis]|eukprot:MONOS_1422.1-p1 / transcript=MONOS_1422.1 / gene=MONOS_1422 / organism=Monocercomonoides_exilis_PA203 / gene_product= Homotypic fusion and vacuole protein sorting (HOPS) complex component Vps39A, putative / transcript_product= Homotypic fusion and vacuole protein sorting (HOPS) complex component Vps39A, putative / location=Mono_scaffold00025:69349-75738(+) / protein_length=2004 / sequence_SO=supercontig / SO=protein_coding / is_pseudo=false
MSINALEPVCRYILPPKQYFSYCRLIRDDLLLVGLSSGAHQLLQLEPPESGRNLRGHVQELPLDKTLDVQVLMDSIIIFLSEKKVCCMLDVKKWSTPVPLPDTKGTTLFAVGAATKAFQVPKAAFQPGFKGMNGAGKLPILACSLEKKTGKREDRKVISFFFWDGQTFQWFNEIIQPETIRKMRFVGNLLFIFTKRGFINHNVATGKTSTEVILGEGAGAVCPTSLDEEELLLLATPTTCDLINIQNRATERESFKWITFDRPDASKTPLIREVEQICGARLEGVQCLSSLYPYVAALRGSHIEIGLSYAQEPIGVIGEDRFREALVTYLNMTGDGTASKEMQSPIQLVGLASTDSILHSLNPMDITYTANSPSSLNPSFMSLSSSPSSSAFGSSRPGMPSPSSSQSASYSQLDSSSASPIRPPVRSVTRFRLFVLSQRAVFELVPAQVEDVVALLQKDHRDADALALLMAVDEEWIGGGGEREREREREGDGRVGSSGEGERGSRGASGVRSRKRELIESCNRNLGFAELERLSPTATFYHYFLARHDIFFTLNWFTLLIRKSPFLNRLKVLCQGKAGRGGAGGGEELPSYTLQTTPTSPIFIMFLAALVGFLRHCRNMVIAQNFNALIAQTEEIHRRTHVPVEGVKDALKAIVETASAHFHSSQELVRQYPLPSHVIPPLSSTSSAETRSVPLNALEKTFALRDAMKLSFVQSSESDLPAFPSFYDELAYLFARPTLMSPREKAEERMRIIREEETKERERGTRGDREDSQNASGMAADAEEELPRVCLPTLLSGNVHSCVCPDPLSLLTLIDTSLVEIILYCYPDVTQNEKSHEKVNGLIISLLNQPVFFADADEMCLKLGEAKQYSILVNFLHQRGLHLEALSMLLDKEAAVENMRAKMEGRMVLDQKKGKGIKDVGGVAGGKRVIGSVAGEGGDEHDGAAGSSSSSSSASSSASSAVFSETMKQLSAPLQKESQRISAFKEIMHYLQRLGPEHLPLISEFSTPLLIKDNELINTTYLHGIPDSGEIVSIYKNGGVGFGSSSSQRNKEVWREKDDRAGDRLLEAKKKYPFSFFALTRDVANCVSYGYDRRMLMLKYPYEVSEFYVDSEEAAVVSAIERERGDSANQDDFGFGAVGLSRPELGGKRRSGVDATSVGYSAGPSSIAQPNSASVPRPLTPPENEGSLLPHAVDFTSFSDHEYAENGTDLASIEEWREGKTPLGKREQVPLPQLNVSMKQAMDVYSVQQETVGVCEEGKALLHDMDVDRIQSVISGKNINTFIKGEVEKRERSDEEKRVTASGYDLDSRARPIPIDMSSSMPSGSISSSYGSARNGAPTSMSSTGSSALSGHLSRGSAEHGGAAHSKQQFPYHHLLPLRPLPLLSSSSQRSSASLSPVSSVLFGPTPQIPERSTWPLQRMNQLPFGLRVFVHDPVHEIDPLDPHEALQIIGAQCPPHRLPFLEFLVEERNSTEPFVHNRLALLYRERIIDLRKLKSVTEESKEDDLMAVTSGLGKKDDDMPGPLDSSTNSATPIISASAKRAYSKKKERFVPAVEEKGEIGYLRLRLINFLKYSRCYSPSELLTPFKDNEDFLEEQVILLSKAGQHVEALRLLVCTMGDIQAAEDYCCVFYDPRLDDDHREEHKIHETLVKVLLESKNVPVVTEYLVKFFGYLEKESMLSLLPETLRVSDAVPFLRLVFESLGCSLRNTRLAHSLLRSEDVLSEGRRVAEMSRRVTITAGTRCGKCGNVMGGRASGSTGMAVAIAPDNTVYHLLCYQEIEKEASKLHPFSPVTGFNYSPPPVPSGLSDTSSSSAASDEPKGSFSFTMPQVSRAISGADSVFLRTTAPSLVAQPLPMTHPSYRNKKQGNEWDEWGDGSGEVIGSFGFDGHFRGRGETGRGGRGVEWSDQLIEERNNMIMDEVGVDASRLLLYEREKEEAEAYSRLKEKEEFAERERELARRREEERKREEAALNGLGNVSGSEFGFLPTFDDSQFGFGDYEHTY